MGRDVRGNLRITDVENAVADGEILASEGAVREHGLLDQKVRFALRLHREAEGARGQQEKAGLHLQKFTLISAL